MQSLHASGAGIGEKTGAGVGEETGGGFGWGKGALGGATTSLLHPGHHTKANIIPTPKSAQSIGTHILFL
jgi:hypothetical protein